MSTALTLQHPHLRALHQDAQAVLVAFSDLQARYTDEALIWKPSSTSWSIAECVEHLTITDQLYMHVLSDVLQTPTRSNSDAAFTPSWTARLLYFGVKPNGSLKIKTLPAADPAAADLDASSVFSAFEEHQHRLYDLMARADGCDLNGNRCTSPLSRFVKLTVGDVFWILIAHQQRHLGQAERVAQHPSFPG